MKIKTRLSVILLVFGVMPILIMFWVATQSGLAANKSFHSAAAFALMGIVLVGLIAPGFIMQFFFTKHLDKIKAFCLDVKKGQYEVHLPVPNSGKDSGSENEFIELMRNMNWMAHCIKVNDMGLRQALVELENSQKEIGQQKMALEKINEEQLIVQAQLEGKTQELTEVVSKLRNLMDNTGQGFLSFGADLRVVGEYSAECVMIFNQEINGESIPKLLYPNDKKQQVFLEALFAKIFNETDDFLRENYLSLLPAEIILDELFISVAYRIINRSGSDRKEILLILTDITERREMERQIQDEKNVLAMVVQTVTHYQQFIKSTHEYKAFCEEELPSILEADITAAEKLSTIFRHIHTWKGTFGQLGLDRLATKLHNLENDLANIRSNGTSEVCDEDLRNCFCQCLSSSMYLWLNEELQILKGILGEGFFVKEDTVIVESSKLKQLEEKVKRLLSPCQASQLITDLRRLRYKPFRELLKMYPDYVINIANNQGKDVHLFDITGSECLVEPEKYSNFAKVLTHVFRNAVAHGLETPDERFEANKDIKGRIECVIDETDDCIVVTISDDGRGIDAEHIRDIAVAKGVCCQIEADKLSKEEAVGMIFADGFSSAASASDLAGRGVGLNAVHEEVEKLKGYIKVESDIGSGTTFTFVLPKLHQAVRYSFASFSNHVLNQTNTYLQQEFGISETKVSAIISNQSVVPMRNISTFIDIHGILRGRLMISADEALAAHLLNKFYPEDNTVTYEKQLIESTFAEVFNTIVGNSLQQISDLEGIDIGPPVTVWAEGASANYADAETKTWNIDTDLGQIYFSSISFENDKEDSNGTCISG
ncbi:ATP-binding protein [Dendrosporobacter sp. 1207_IL3150]|uniref:ATP-binding protein n=1 Tax=Dendrosporobacter sp. 1207_IL3150 TaxID=3084054 RepID=UPI002FD89562